jgi:hypothetical protein
MILLGIAVNQDELKLLSIHAEKLLSALHPFIQNNTQKQIYLPNKWFYIEIRQRFIPFIFTD